MTDTAVDEPPMLARRAAARPHADNDNHDSGFPAAVTDRRALAAKENGWRARTDAERTEESDRMTECAAAVARRQFFGGFVSAPANDNQAWPLAEQLRRDGNEPLLTVAERYRAVYDASVTETTLIGTMPDPDMTVDQRVHNRADGSVGYKGPRVVKGAVGRLDGDDGTYKAVPINDDVRAEIESGTSTFPRKPATPVTKKWNGDRLLIAAIDSKVTLRRLTRALGPLRLTFEDAVLHCATFTDIGRAKGGNSVSASAIGRAYVMDGLEIIQREFRDIDREGRAATRP